MKLRNTIIELIIITLFFLINVNRYMPDTLMIHMSDYYLVSKYYIMKSFTYFYIFSSIAQLFIVFWPKTIDLNSQIFITLFCLFISFVLLYISQYFIFLILSRLFLGIAFAFLFPIVIHYVDLYKRPSYVSSVLIFLGSLGYVFYDLILRILIKHYKFYNAMLLFGFITFILLLYFYFVEIKKKKPSYESKSFSFFLDWNLYFIIIMNFIVAGVFVGFPEVVLSSYLASHYDSVLSTFLKSIFFFGLASSSVMLFFLSRFVNTKKMIISIICYLLISMNIFYFTKVNYIIMLIILFCIGSCGAFYLLLFFLYQKRIGKKHNIELIGMLNFSMILSGSFFSFLFNYMKYYLSFFNIIYIVQILLIIVLICFYFKLHNIDRK